jgi:hypothetical protein
MVSFRQIMLLGDKSGQRPLTGLGGQVDPDSLGSTSTATPGFYLREPDDDAVDRRDFGKILPDRQHDVIVLEQKVRLTC